MRIENDNDWLNKIDKSLDVNFISIKKHEIEMWYFYFQVRESPDFFIFKYGKEGNHLTLIGR